MIYVVSGYRRSGTSAMMGALGAGGIPILAVPDFEAMNVEKDGYKINPGNFFEITRAVYMEPFVLQQVLQDGHAIKIFFDGLPTLPAGDYRIIYMQRDPEEIKASLEITNKIITDSQVRVKTRANGEEYQSKVTLQEGGNKPFDVYSPYAQNEIDWVLGICDQRNDMELTVVDYHDLVSDPKSVLESLNLPIDIEAASSVIKPEYHRVRGYSYGSKRVECI